MDRKRLSPLSRKEAAAADLLIALVVGGIGVWRELAQVPQPIRLIQAPVSWYVGAQVLAAILLLRRRFNPVPIGFACAAISLVSPVQAAAVSVYSAGAHSARRDRAALVLVATLVGFAFGGQLWRLEDPWTSILVLTVSFVVGLYVRARRGLLRNTAEIAQWSQAKQEWIAATATNAERTRLAAEMHDVVSHRFNAVMLGAGTLLMSEREPRRRAAIDDLRLQAAGALHELREVFGTLAVDGKLPDQEERVRLISPAQSRQKVERLVAEWQRLGVQIQLELVGGEPISEDGSGYSASVDRALYRVVEEGLTNAVKHAQGSTVRILLDLSREGVRVQLSNTGPGAHAVEDLAESGSGRGLVGLRERIEMLGGEFQAAPGLDGGFQLSATLPGAASAGTRNTP